MSHSEWLAILDDKHPVVDLAHSLCLPRGELEEKVSSIVAERFQMHSGLKAEAQKCSIHTWPLPPCMESGDGSRQLVCVPNVEGLTQAAATTAITAAKLMVGTITQQTSNTVTTGKVISQGPASGSSVAQGSPVNLVISSGQK